MRRIFSRLSGKDFVPPDQEARRLDEKRRSLQKATGQWLSLLRDMEHQGQSDEAAYERYYKAYLDARHQQKEVELQLFNLRSRRAS